MFEDRSDAGRELARAVAQVYRNGYDVPDAEVIAILEKWRAEHAEDSSRG